MAEAAAPANAAGDPSGGVAMATMTGVVKAWLDDRGMGFITPDSGGEDVFVHRSSLLDGQFLVIGAPVTFVDDWDVPKNKRIATNVMGAVARPEGKGVGKAPAKSPAAPVGAAAWATGAKGSEPAPSDNVWVGDLPAEMQKDQLWEVFGAYGAVVDCRVVPPKQPGQNASGLVRFSHVREATWVVQNLNGNIPQGLDGPIIAKFASNSGSGGGGKGAAAAPAASSWAAAYPAGPASGAVQGTVKAWIEERGMGFITGSASGEDCFVHRSALMDGQSLVIGSQVTFEEDWDYQKNKRIAKNVYGSGAGPGKGAAGGYDEDGPPGAGGQGGDNCFVGDLPPEIDKAALQALFEPYGRVADCRVLPPKQPGQKACGLVRFGSVEEATWVVEKLNGNIPHGLDAPVTVRFANNSAGGGAGAGGSPAWAPPPPSGPHAAARSSPYGPGAGGAGKGWGGKAVGGKACAKGGGKPGMAGSIETLFQGLKGAGVLGGGRAPEECQLYVKNLPPDTTDLDLFKLFSPFGAMAPSGVKAMLNDDGSCKGFGFVDYVDPECAQLAISSLNGFVCADGGSIGVAHKRAKGPGDH